MHAPIAFFGLDVILVVSRRCVGVSSGKVQDSSLELLLRLAFPAPPADECIDGIKDSLIAHFEPWGVV